MRTRSLGKSRSPHGSGDPHRCELQSLRLQLPALGSHRAMPVAKVVHTFPEPTRQATAPSSPQHQATVSPPRVPGQAAASLCALRPPEHSDQPVPSSSPALLCPSHGHPQKTLAGPSPHSLCPQPTGWCVPVRPQCPSAPSCVLVVPVASVLCRPACPWDTVSDIRAFFNGTDHSAPHPGSSLMSACNAGAL